MLPMQTSAACGLPLFLPTLPSDLVTFNSYSAFISFSLMGTQLVQFPSLL